MNVVDCFREALGECLVDPAVVVLSQLGKYGLGGLTTGLADSHPDQILTMPVAENLMHAAGMGLALAGMRPVIINERMDFLALAMDPLVNHAAVWPARHPDLALPMVVVAVVGKGHGQGPQHSKNLTPWFRGLQGWTVWEPSCPTAAGVMLRAAVRGRSPVLYVLHREFFHATHGFKPPRPEGVGICGASQRHEMEFYR